MMPFPMAPFDMVWTGCMEYIPGVARSGRACGQLQACQRGRAKASGQRLVCERRGRKTAATATNTRGVARRAWHAVATCDVVRFE
jgi:hypothetical protein